MNDCVTLQSPDAFKSMDLSPLPEKPLVSVLICSFNYEKFIGKTIESALNQSYSDIEIIVCDDGSVDNSCSVVESYAGIDARVKLIRKEHGGLPSTLNRAFHESTGEIICILDADDLFFPKKIEMVVVRFKTSPDAGLVVHPLMMIDPEGTPLQPFPLVDNFEEGWLAERVVKRGGRLRLMPASTLSFRRELGACIFPIPKDIFTPDGYICTLLPLFTSVAVVRETLTYYMVHAKNSSSILRDFSTREEGINTTIRYLDQLRDVVESVNERLKVLGAASVKLEIVNHLDYGLRQYSLYLLQGRNLLFLLKNFSRLASLLMKDNLYTITQRSIFLAIYFVATFLPVRARMFCISRMHPPNKLKLKILSMLRKLSEFSKKTSP